MMMNAMFWHNLIEVVLELAVITLCVIAFLAVVITGYLYYTEGPGSVPDEVWELYTKGGKYNYQHMGESGNSFAPRAYSDPRGRKNNISGNYDPDAWDAVEYDDDGKFEVTPDETYEPPAADIELEIETNELDEQPI